MNTITAISDKKRNGLFWACFISLMATSFGFAIRAMLITEWGEEFHLSKTQMGDILGVGLWPFAISIVIFSLIIDRIGYGKAMIFAFTCHITSVVITLFANGFEMLYVGTLIFALGNGTIEATINPVVVTLFKENKTKWMNILHAGWPGGMVVSGIFAMSLGPDVKWQYKIAILLVPMLLYGILMLNKKFPVHERVKAGVSFREMLSEVGILGALIIVSLMVFEVGNFFDSALWLNIVIIVIMVGIFGVYTRSLGRPLFIFLLLIMFPLATTELGTDSWIVDLMSSSMGEMGLQAGWILIYTAAIMTIFRSIAGPLLKIFKPIGLLILCSVVAAIALFSLSIVSGILIFVVATVYGFAKAYFWPTMIGIAGERFPKGGALTLNMITGVGMIGVGIVGAVYLGYIQDTEIDRKIMDYDKSKNTALHSEYITIEKKSIFGKYFSVDSEKLATASKEDQQTVSGVQLKAQKSALKMVAILPLVMLVCFIFLFFWFRSRGGYKSIILTEGDT